MKQIFFLLVFVTSVCAAYAVPAKSQLTGQQTRRTAADLFVAGKGAEAVAHLRAQIVPETGPDGSKLAVVEGLIDVACSLYNQRRLDVAGEVVRQAFIEANGIIVGSSPASATRRAALLSSLGMLSEHVLVELTQAESFYRAAEALNPADPTHRARKQAVIEKQRPQGG